LGYTLGDLITHPGRELAARLKPYLKIALAQFYLIASLQNATAIKTKVEVSNSTKQWKWCM
jgi:hypothetical protein